jgi:hypothetical protein
MGCGLSYFPGRAATLARLLPLSNSTGNGSACLRTYALMSPRLVSWLDLVRPRAMAGIWDDGNFGGSGLHPQVG